MRHWAPSGNGRVVPIPAGRVFPLARGAGGTLNAGSPVFESTTSDGPMLDRILRILQENARLSDAEVAQRLGAAEADVRAAIDSAHADGRIRGYRVITTDDASPSGDVWSVVEVGLTPERERGFDRVAERISRFPEVVSCRLVSGDYDLLVEVRGQSLHEVAAFVSERLSTIEGVRSTRTHFMLKRYKEDGVILFAEDKVERLPVTP